LLILNSKESLELMAQEKPKSLINKKALYPIGLIALMYLWWVIAIKPNDKIIQASRYAHQGHFQYKEETSIFSYFTSEDRHTLKGFTMGSISYQIHYFDEQDRNLKPEIDSLLNEFLQTFSTYEESSLVSQFNKNHSSQINEWWINLHNRALKVHEETSGAFDPTIKPLLSYWGFGSSPEDFNPNDSIIDSLKNLVDYKSIKVKDDSIFAMKPWMQLDYGAIAKGYALDLVADLLSKKGIESYMIEIGGELSVGANKPNGEQWKLAIEDPKENARTPLILLSIEHKSMATSGNYRNYRVDPNTGEKYQHTINPNDGRPVRNNLLSISVLHDKCLEADAYATGLMVMGTENAIAFAQEHKLEICLIYSDEEGNLQYYYSPEFKKTLNDE